MTGLKILLGSLIGIFGLIWLIAGLVAKAQKAGAAGTGATTGAVSRIAKKLSLKKAIGVLVALLLAWWLGSSIYLKTTGKTTRDPQLSRLPRSGSFELKAGGELVHTGLRSQPGQWESYQQIGEPKTFWRKTSRGNFKISSKVFSARVTRPGVIQLIPGPEDTTVRVTVYK